MAVLLADLRHEHGHVRPGHARQKAHGPQVLQPVPCWTGNKRRAYLIVDH